MSRRCDKCDRDQIALQLCSKCLLEHVKLMRAEHRDIFNNKELEVIIVALDNYTWELESFRGDDDDDELTTIQAVKMAEERLEIARRILERIQKK